MDRLNMFYNMRIIQPDLNDILHLTDAKLQIGISVIQIMLL